MTYTENFSKWYSYANLNESMKSELETIKDDDTEIKERFSTPLEFGTAGLRGIMRAGINGMNIYTVRQATQGIANLITSENRSSDGVVIARDSRINSEIFSKAAAEVLAANGIKVYIFDDIRPTAELSFAILHLGAVAGINITASHNPREYNGYKAYWDDGAQLPPDYALTVQTAIAQTDIFHDVKITDFDIAAANGLIITIGEELDREYLKNVSEQTIQNGIIEKAGEKFSVVYTPIHGAGYKLVPEILRQKGVSRLFVVEEQRLPDGNFPTVKYPNPEFKEVFTIGIEKAKKENCALLVGTDPDADRVGIVVRDTDGDYVPLTGNQVGALLLDYIITSKKSQNTLPANACAIKTIVSTELAAKICADNGVEMMNVLTGFKFIGEKINQFASTGDYTYIFGFEESYGYLAGTYARDKDAVVASMLICEMAAYYMTKDMTLYDAMEELYKKYGYYCESVQSIEFGGLDGAEKMSRIMGDVRENPPLEIGGFKVITVSDYKSGQKKFISTGKTESTGLPPADVLSFDLEGGSKVIIRPSGTEPKIKLYFLAAATDRTAANTLVVTLKSAAGAFLSI